MPEKDRKTEAAVQTPLHLLQVLTRTLNDHLAQACDQAQTDARKVLEKLDREQQKIAEKLEQTQQKLAGDNADGASSDKRQGKLNELNERMEAVRRARSEAEDYVRQLQNDVRQTLRLAKGLERIDHQASQAIEKRNNPEAAAARRPAGRRSRGRRPAAASGEAAAPAAPPEPQG